MFNCPEIPQLELWLESIKLLNFSLYSKREQCNNLIVVWLTVYIQAANVVNRSVGHHLFIKSLIDHYCRLFVSGKWSYYLIYKTHLLMRERKKTISPPWSFICFNFNSLIPERFGGELNNGSWHYYVVILSAIASQINSLTIVYSTVYSDADQRKHQSSASLAFVRLNSPVTGEFPAQRASNAENVSIWWRRHGRHATDYFLWYCSNVNAAEHFDHKSTLVQVLAWCFQTSYYLKQCIYDHTLLL